MEDQLIEILLKMHSNLIMRKLLKEMPPSERISHTLNEIDEDFYNLQATLNMLCPPPSIIYHERPDFTKVSVTMHDVVNISQQGAQC